jgi:transcriptional regulator with XRE-family HTH domain
MLKINLIQDYIYKNKLTADEFAKKIGVKRGGLYNIYRNKTTSHTRAVKISSVLNIPLHELYCYPQLDEEPIENIEVTDIPVKLLNDKSIHVGLAIKKRREEIGISKAELAKRLGCTPQNIDSIEGRKSINFEQIFKINKALKFNLFDNYSTNTLEFQKEIETLKAMLNDKEKLIKLYEENLGLKKK